MHLEELVEELLRTGDVKRNSIIKTLSPCEKASRADRFADFLDAETAKKKIDHRGRLHTE